MTDEGGATGTGNGFLETCFTLLRHAPLALVLAITFSVSACQTALPRADAETRAGWNSYDEARKAIEDIVPYKSRKDDLTAKGIDPYTNPSITILTYSDIIQRFAVGSAVKPDELDRGISECLKAGKACTAYAIAVKKNNRNRVGNFWADSFAFRRITEITGWTFNALIIFVGDMVVYTLYGGQPVIHETETVRNPLGPLQSWGERIGGLR